MTSKIRVLNDHTINKIAAGEVIEQPASVVKELVENALDAGANDICIEIKGGGRQLIRITDNGCGMNSDDALLCLERHATSKIKNLEDIYNLNTMGFRGEAMPSIASISKFTILTCSAEASNGTMVIVDGGKIMKCCDATRTPGTTIEVKSLFFNVPVRLKFQKSPVNDTNEILKIVNILALGYPNVKFQLISDQNTILTTPFCQSKDFGNQLGERIVSVLGKDFHKETCQLEVSHGDYILRGFIGKSSHHRQNKTGQFLFINNRGINSPLIAFSIREGYGTMLPTTRYPVYVLHLTMPGDLVDVNVHPQKKEVKLRHEHALKEVLIRAVESSLRITGNHKHIENPLQTTTPFEIDSNEYSLDEKNFLNPITPSFSSTPSEVTRSFPNTYEMYFADEKIPSKSIPEFVEPHVVQQVLPVTNSKIPPKVLSTIKRYILLEPESAVNIDGLFSLKMNRDGVFLVDQRAAHSRVIYERLVENSNSHDYMQKLIIPYTLELSPHEAANLRIYIDDIMKMGIQIHESGPNTFLIDAIPQIFGNIEVNTLILSILNDLSDFQDRRVIQKEKEKQIAITASRAAISHNEHLGIPEAQELVDQLMQCKMPFQCPQGKSTILHINLEDLAKHFQK